MALAPAGVLACSSLAARHAPAPVASELIAALSRAMVRSAPDAAETQQRVATRSFVRSVAPKAPAPWRAPSSPAPSQAPPARA